MIFLPKEMPLELIHAEAAQKIKPYHPKRMEAIIELIQRANFATLRKKKKKVQKEKPYVYSRDLNNISGNYKEYIDLLFFLELIAIDNDYSHIGINDELNPFTKNYYFTPIYGEKLFYQKTINSDRKDVLYNNIYKNYNNNYESKLLDNLLLFNLNIFYAYLEFNYDDIIENLNNDFETKIKGGISNKSRNKLKKSFLQYNSALYQIHNIASKVFNFHRNYTNHRLYSPLTNFPKKYRKHFTLGEKKLVSVDLSNAQPFLSLLLFNKNFWLGDESSEPLRLNIDTIGLKPFFKHTIYNYFSKNNFQSLEKYTSLVLNDNLYTYLMNEFTPGYTDEKKARKTAKTTMYRIMFSQAESEFDIKPSSKRAKFRNAFPDIYDFWAEIKNEGNQNGPIILNPITQKVQEGHSMLSMILQRMEAYLFLDIIVPYVLKNHSNIPLIPIHDCLTTTEEHVYTLEAIMRTLITEHTGIIPHIKREPWE